MKTPIHKLVTIIEDAYLEGERWKMPRCRNPSVLPRSIVINRCVQIVNNIKEGNATSSSAFNAKIKCEEQEEGD